MFTVNASAWFAHQFLAVEILRKTEFLCIGIARLPNLIDRMEDCCRWNPLVFLVVFNWFRRWRKWGDCFILIILRFGDVRVMLIGEFINVFMFILSILILRAWLWSSRIRMVFVVGIVIIGEITKFIINLMTWLSFPDCHLKWIILFNFLIYIGSVVADNLRMLLHL